MAHFVTYYMTWGTYSLAPHAAERPAPAAGRGAQAAPGQIQCPLRGEGGQGAGFADLNLGLLL